MTTTEGAPTTEWRGAGFPNGASNMTTDLVTTIREALAEYADDGRLRVDPLVLPSNLDSCALDLARRIEGVIAQGAVASVVIAMK
jgi:hypothetical protein